MQQMLFYKLSPKKPNIDRTAYQIAKYNCGAATTACFAMYIYCLLALYMLCKNQNKMQHSIRFKDCNATCDIHI